MRRADIPKISGLCLSSAAMYSSTELFIPISNTSNPAPSIIIETKFLPISWISPLTVPITTVPTGFAPVSASNGFNISIPPFIALAASSTSGTKRIPSLKSIPTTVMPSTKASPRTRSADHPLAKRISVPSMISSFKPS